MTLASVLSLFVEKKLFQKAQIQKNTYIVGVSRHFSYEIFRMKNQLFAQNSPQNSLILSQKVYPRHPQDQAKYTRFRSTVYP